MAGKTTGQPRNLTLASLTRILGKSDADRPTIHACGFRDGIFYRVRTALQAHNVQHDEATTNVASELYAGRPIGIHTAYSCCGGKVPRAYHQFGRTRG